MFVFRSGQHCILVHYEGHRLLSVKFPSIFEVSHSVSRNVFRVKVDQAKINLT